MQTLEYPKVNYSDSMLGAIYSIVDHGNKYDCKIKLNYRKILPESDENFLILYSIYEQF